MSARRKYRLLLVIESDDWDGLDSELVNAANRLYQTPGAEIEVTSGGSQSSRVQLVTVVPHQTHEHYFEQIEAEMTQYRNEKKASQPASEGTNE